MALTAKDVEPFRPGKARVADHLGRGDTAAAIAEAATLLASAPTEEHRSWLQHKLAMSGIELSDDQHPDPAFLDWLLDQTRRFLHELNVPLDEQHVPCQQTRISFLLEWACERGNSEAVKLLVGKYGADPNISDPRQLGNTLDMAARGGCTEAVEWLLDRGTPVNIEHCGRMISMCLLAAASDGRTDICRLLVERGAVINCVNDQGQSPLNYARWSGCQETIDYLVSVGAQKGREILGKSPTPEVQSEPEPPKKKRKPRKG